MAARIRPNTGGVARLTVSDRPKTPVDLKGRPAAAILLLRRSALRALLLRLVGLRLFLLHLRLSLRLGLIALGLALPRLKPRRRMLRMHRVGLAERVQHPRRALGLVPRGL